MKFLIELSIDEIIEQVRYLNHDDTLTLMKRIESRVNYLRFTERLRDYCNEVIEKCGEKQAALRDAETIKKQNTSTRTVENLTKMGLVDKQNERK